MAQPSPLHERTVAMICKALEGAYSSTHRGARAQYNEHRLTRCAVRLSPNPPKEGVGLAS